MRLDHLLSREPSCGEQLVCLPVGVGVLVVFLCLHVFTTQCGWWVWVRVFGLGIKSYTSEHTVGFTFNTVLASTALVVVARTTSRVYWCGLCVVGCL